MNSAGSQLVIGAPFNDGNGGSSGHARVYNWSGTAWFQIGIDLDGEAANDWSGNSVSINAVVGDQVAVGAWLNNGNGNDAGHVRAYQNILASNVDEVENEDQVSIYPNPARENLILETQNSIGEVVQITSITGALILEFIITKEKEKIDVSGFQNGIYFLRVGERAQKIVVSR